MRKFSSLNRNVTVASSSYMQSSKGTTNASTQAGLSVYFGKGGDASVARCAMHDIGIIFCGAVIVLFMFARTAAETASEGRKDLEFDATFDGKGNRWQTDLLVNGGDC